MSFVNQKIGALEYLTSEILEGSVHCFSTRFGGVSEGTLSSLNLGVHRGDRAGNVWENYRILGEAVGFEPKQTVFTHQVHTDHIAKVGVSDRGAGLVWPVEEERDGLITDCPGVALTIFSADCTPVLLYDPVRQAVGACHAGWRGTALGIAKKTAEAMIREYGCKPENIRAAIGPNIAACCFETREDVPNAMRAALGEEAEACITQSGEKFHVDLKEINRLWLRRAGVTQVDISKECTACRPDRFWSHRRVGNARGSLAAVIMLQGGRT